MSYQEKLKDPRWQKKRLEILQRDGWKCKWCGEEKQTLHIHHLKYQRNKEPWEYEDKFLITLCENCHEIDSIYRKEAEQNILEALALSDFHVDSLNMMADYILEHSEELKQLIFREEYKEIDEWQKKQEENG